MALTFTLKGAGLADQTDGNSYAYSATSMVSGEWYVLSAVSSHASAAPVMTVAATGVTFTQLGTAGGELFPNGTRRQQAWRFQAVATGTLGITITATASTSMDATVVHLGGADPTTPVVQTVSNSGTAAASATVTLAAYGNASNLPLIFQTNNSNVVHSVKAGFTELYDAGHAAPVNSMVVAYGSSADTTPNTTWVGNVQWSIFAMEVAEAASGVTLVVADVTAPVGLLDAVAITQTHNLAVSDVTAPVGILDSVAITQTHVLAVGDVTAPVGLLDATTITQTHILVVSDVTAPVGLLDEVTISSTTTLVVSDVTAPVGLLDAVTITQTHNLVVADVTAAVSVLDAVVITQTHVLVVADVTAPVGLLDAVTVSSHLHERANIVGLVARDYRVVIVVEVPRHDDAAQEHRMGIVKAEHRSDPVPDERRFAVVGSE